MDKVQIDKVVQILQQFAQSEDFNYISELTEFIKNQEEINEKLEEIKNNPEEADILGFFNDVSTAIQSEIPEDELDYFYAEVYSIGRGIDEAFGIDGEKKEKAQAIWNARIAERVEGKDDDEKLRISEEYDNPEIGEMALFHLSDSKKVELLQNEGTYTKKFEKSLIESIENPNLKIEAINYSTLSEHDKTSMIMNADDNFKMQALQALQSQTDKLEVIQTIKDPKRKIELINKYISSEKDKYKAQFIQEIEDPKERIEIGLKELQEEGWKARLIGRNRRPKRKARNSIKRTEK